jgi:hypothetical protein
LLRPERALLTGKQQHRGSDETVQRQHDSTNNAGSMLESSETKANTAGVKEELSDSAQKTLVSPPSNGKTEAMT